MNQNNINELANATPQIPSHKLKIQVTGRKICLNDEIKNNPMTDQFQIVLVFSTLIRIYFDPVWSYLVLFDPN